MLQYQGQRTQSALLFNHSWQKKKWWLLSQSISTEEKLQTTSSRIRTRVNVSISNDDNCYTKHLHFSCMCVKRFRVYCCLCEFVSQSSNVNLNAPEIDDQSIFICFLHWVCVCVCVCVWQEQPTPLSIFLASTPHSWTLFRSCAWTYDKQTEKKKGGKE